MNDELPRSPKVAIVEPVGGHGGMNYYDFGLANGVIDAGGDCSLYTSIETKVPIGLGFKCYRTFVGIYGKESRLVRGGRFVKCLLISLINARKNGSEIAHYHFFHAGVMELLCVLISKALGLRVIVTVHDVESFSGGGSSRLSRTIFSLADRLIAHNRVSFNELRDRVRVDSSKIEIIPHGNYLEFLDTTICLDNARLKLGIDPGKKMLLFFGQIKAVKGLDVLLEAMAELVKTHSDIELVIAGKVWKDDFGLYEKLIQRLDLSRWISLRIRYISDDEAQLYYVAADVVVLPYRKIYQSGVLLMAMSYRKPVVVSDLPGMLEVVEDGITGFVFEAGSVKSLVDTLNYALGDPVRLRSVGEAGFELMKDRYSWSLVGEKTARLYREMR